MNNQQLLDSFASSLRAKTGYEVLDSEVGEGVVRFQGRVPNQPGVMNAWISFMGEVLHRESSANYTCDFSKRYFLKPDGRLMFAWRFILRAREGDLRPVLNLLMNILNTVQTPNPTMTMIPVRGVSHEGPNGKGASPAGSRPVGPAAAMMLKGYGGGGNFS